MDIMFVTDTKTTVVYQTYRQTLIMYTLLPWSTVKTNDCSLYLVTLTYVFSEGKVCIVDQDLSLVVSLKGVYTFFGGVEIGLMGLVKFFITGIITIV